MDRQPDLAAACIPAEALASIAPHVPIEMLEAYRVLFEHMPTSFLFERTMFVHGGIPREDTFAARYHDLVEPQRRRDAVPDDVERSGRDAITSRSSCSA